jgi:hypothetical protein
VSWLPTGIEKYGCRGSDRINSQLVRVYGPNTPSRNYTGGGVRVVALETLNPQATTQNDDELRLQLVGDRSREVRAWS